ncbi:3279_t:CDS:2, partial [Diversispora eburnea]
GVRLDCELANARVGVYTFYIQDTNINFTNIQSLKEMLDVNNPYITYLQYISEISHQYITKLSLIIHTNIPELDQKTNNMFTALNSSNTSIWINDDNILDCNVLNNNSDSSAYNNSHHVGHKIIFPATFVESLYNMFQHYQDTIVLVHIRKSDLFIIVTCNLKWLKIKASSFPEQKVEDISNVTELPHTYFLLILHPDDKPMSPDNYDEIVQAEIPNSATNLKTYTTVITSIVHDLCGYLNPNTLCITVEENGHKQ